MRILAVGDVCSKNGLDFLQNKLPQLRRFYGADLVVVNGENSAPTGRGVQREGLETIFSAGADVITTGNHAFDQRGFEHLFDSTPGLIRPLNLQKGVPGQGSFLFDLGYTFVLVVNVMGASFMNLAVRNCYDVLDELLLAPHPKLVIVDYHAETTAEKIAFARYYDGRITLLFGTHTHVQTADEQIFEGGTAFITDIGMTGPKKSVIGIDIEAAVKKQRYCLPVRLSPADGPSILSGIVVDADHETGKATSIERFSVTG